MRDKLKISENPLDTGEDTILKYVGVNQVQQFNLNLYK
jgi:hypothetical protein